MNIFVRTRLVYILLGALCGLAALAATNHPAHSDTNAPVFTSDSGSYELIIFSDYFCTPCQKVEKEWEKTIAGLIERGNVKVTFVDLPIYKLTPLYGKYFLYAFNAASDYKEALRARQLLFEKASRFGAITEQHLANAMREANIPIKEYDTNKSLERYKEMITKYRAHSTPTFVFIYSPADIRKYSGSELIRKGMAEFLNTLEQ